MWEKKKVGKEETEREREIESERERERETVRGREGGAERKRVREK